MPILINIVHLCALEYIKYWKQIGVLENEDAIYATKPRIQAFSFDLRGIKCVNDERKDVTSGGRIIIVECKVTGQKWL